MVTLIALRLPSLGRQIGGGNRGGGKKHERMMEEIGGGGVESNVADPVREGEHKRKMERARERGDRRELRASIATVVGDLLGHLAAL